MMQNEGKWHWKSVKSLCIILAAITFIVYANTLQNGYVLDDGMVLRHNAFVKKGVAGVGDLLTSPRTAGVELYFTNEFYRPLSMVMFALEVQLFGLTPAANHFFSILSYIGCVVMLFLFLVKLFGRDRVMVAFVAGGVFALHPIHTEVVANIKSRDELLCFFFGFWSLNLFWQYVGEGKSLRLAAGLLALFLAYLAKETVITFAAIIPLLFFVHTNSNKKRAAIVCGGYVIVTAIFLLLRMVVLERFNANGSNDPAFIENALIAAPSMMSRLATEILVLGKYLLILFVPYPMLCDYGSNTIPFTDFGNVWVWVALLSYCGLGLVAIYRLTRNRKDEWAFGILFYLITLSLFSNIVFLLGAQMADRFLFFASTGFCIIVALAAESLLQTGQTALKQTAVIIGLVIICLIWSGMTIARNRDWKDNYTLYKTDLEKAPSNARLHYWLASDLTQIQYNATTDTARQHELDMQAIQLLQKAVDIYPGFSGAIAEIGRIYEREHLYDSAIYYDRQAVRADPDDYTGNFNLGSVYYLTGRYEEALGYISRALILNPKLKVAHQTRANCYLQLRQYDKAIADCNNVLEADENDADAHQLLGNIYLRQRNFEAAIAHFKTVVAQKPKYANAMNNLGVAYLNAGQYQQAIAEFNNAIAINPGYISSYSNLARALYGSGQYIRAIDAVNKELALDPTYDADMPILALSYQKTGNQALAMKYAELARRKYPDFKLQ